MPKRVLIDACALVPISLCDVLLELADAELFRPFWSEMILTKLQHTLIEDLQMPPQLATTRIRHMRNAFRGSMVTDFEDLIPSMTNNSKDRHVLAAAVKAKCGIITTADLGGFPTSALAPFGVAAIRPDDFLISLLAEDQDQVWQIIDRKRASYHKPPRTMTEFCHQLGKLVPLFADRLLAISPK